MSAKPLEPSEKIEMSCGMTLYQADNYKGFALNSLCKYLEVSNNQLQRLMKENNVEWKVTKVVVPIRAKPIADTYDLDSLVTLLRLVRDTSNTYFSGVKAKAQKLSEAIKEELAGV